MEGGESESQGVSVIPYQLGDSSTAHDGPEEEGGMPASRRKGTNGHPCH